MKNRLSGTLWAMGLSLILAASVQAQTWIASPGSGDWNTDPNWTGTAPNSPSAFATFGTSSVTSLTLSAPTFVDTLQFNGGANSYSIDTNGNSFNLSGAGVVNNSGVPQTLINSDVVNAGVVTYVGNLSFANSASASNAKINNNSTFGFLQLLDNSTAGNSTVNNNGNFYLYNSSTAGSATITNNYYLYLFDNSDAGAASITNNSYMGLYQTSSLSDATINNTATGNINFYGTGGPGSTAGSATITSSGNIAFFETSTAGSAVITITGGLVTFVDDSVGGSAQFVFANNTGGIDLSSHNGAVTLASLQGDGTVHMGINNVAVGTGNQSTTFSGNFDDNVYSSSLTKLGSGTFTVNGANTYDGGTNILQGTLLVDTNGVLGTGTVQNSATLGFINSANAGNLTYSNGLSGTMDFHNASDAGNSDILNNGGLLTFHDTSTADSASINNTGGVLVFTDNSSTGSTTITNNAAGVIELNLSSDASSSRFVLNGGGSFDISGHSGAATVASVEGSSAIILGGNDLTTGANNLNTTLSGVISGSGGGLIKVGSGILTLSGINTYTGGTTVTGGVLVVSADNNMGAAGGLLSLQGSTLLTSGAVNSIRPIDLTGGTTINTSGYDSTLGGTISGSGVLNKTGSGTLVLSGLNTYSGFTAILGGTLALGSPTALGLSDAVSLINGTMKMSGGPGSVSWSGDYIQSAGTTLSLGMGGTVVGQWDSLNMGGVALLNGTLNIYSYGGFVPQVGSSVDVITSGNGLTGQFSQWTTPAGIRWVPVYSYYNLTLTAIQPSFLALAQTPNQKAVASMLDGLYGNGQFTSLMLDLGTQAAAPLQADYDLISPEQLTAVYPVLYAASQSRAKAIEDRLSGIVGVNAPRLSAAQAARWDMDSPMYADSNHQAIQDRRVISDAYSYRDQTAGRWGSFLDTTEDLANIGDDSNASGYKFTVTGITAGVDYRISKDMAAGLLLGYDLGSTSSASGGKLEVNAGHAGLYGGWGHNGLHVEVLGEAGLPTLKTTRAAYGGTAMGSATGLEFSGWLNGGYDFKLGTTTLGLFAGGQYTYASLNAFTEDGSTLPLAYPSQNQNDLRADVGVRTSRAWRLGSMILTPNLGVSYEHQFDGYATDMTAALAVGGDSFTVQGPAIGQDAVAVGAGVNLQFAQGIGAFVQYDGKFMIQNYDRQNFSGGVNVGF